MLPLPPISTLFPYTTLFRSDQTSSIGTITEPLQDALDASSQHIKNLKDPIDAQDAVTRKWALDTIHAVVRTYAASLRPADRKSTRLNSSHTVISYAVFCLKK